jgi:hypothetical protein
VTGGRGDDQQVSESALWWPPSKVAGHYLAPYLASRREELEAPTSGIDVEVHVRPDGIRRRAIIGADPDGHARAISLDRGKP